MAQSGALRHYLGMRCADPTQAVGILAWVLRRRYGLTALRVKLDRVAYVGRGASAADHRRVVASQAHAARVRAAAGQLLSGPRARASERH